MCSIGEIIKKYRTQTNISQRELGRRINMTGQMISKIEKNETNPSNETILKIATELNIPSDIIKKYINSPMADLLLKSFKDYSLGVAERVREMTIDELYSNGPAFKSFDDYKDNLFQYWEDVVIWYPLDEVNNLNLDKLSDEEINEISKALELTFKLKIAEIKNRNEEKPTE